MYIFLFALTPLPDDILFLPLGMIKYPFWKCIIPGWLGKNFTTMLYCCWPILVAIGFLTQGIQSSDKSNIITEAILLLVTITVMFFIMAFNWTKFLEKRGEGIHHFSFKVKDVDASLIKLKKRRVQLIDNKSRKVRENEKVAFLSPKITNRVFVALVQQNAIVRMVDFG